MKTRLEGLMESFVVIITLLAITIITITLLTYLSLFTPANAEEVDYTKHIIPLKIWLISFVSMYLCIFLFGLVADYEIKKYKKKYVFYLIKITQFSIMGVLGLVTLPAWGILMFGFFAYIFDLVGGGWNLVFLIPVILIIYIFGFPILEKIKDTKIFKIVKYDRFFHLFIFLIIIFRIFLVDPQQKISTVNLENQDEVTELVEDILKGIEENTVVDKKTTKIILKDSDSAKYKFLYYPDNNKRNEWERFKQSSSNYNFWVEVRNFDRVHWTFSWQGFDNFDEALKLAFDSCNKSKKKRNSKFKKSDFCVPYFINYNDVVRKTTRIEKITYLEKYYGKEKSNNIIKKNPLALEGY